MVPIAVHGDAKAALNQRLESIGWGLLLIIIGALWLTPSERVPDGAWLIAAGAIMLGVNVVRYLNDIKMRGVSVLLGFLAVIFGVGAFVGMDIPFIPVLIICFGVGTILRPWFEPLPVKEHS